MLPNVIDNNIDNLTTLWILASKEFNGFRVDSSFNIAAVPDSDWPNRVWNTNYSNKTNQDDVLDIMRSNPTKLIFAKWYLATDGLVDESQELGMQLASTQVGMSLLLRDYAIYECSTDIVLSEVESDASIVQWSSVFQQCFGYSIPSFVIKALVNKVKYSLIVHHDIVVGCVSTFVKGNDIGIHSLGILKDFRRKGYADEVMNLLLADAKKAELNYAHLQSSAMGQSIYLKLGFKKIFQLASYRYDV